VLTDTIKLKLAEKLFSKNKVDFFKIYAQLINTERKKRKKQYNKAILTKI